MKNNNNIEKTTFADLTDNRQIRIPRIQRDYAQGRNNKDVNEIRASFVRSLIRVVTGKKAVAELDFVYGSNKDNAFEPLDGQQRLTTLFLLNWVLGINLKNPNGEAVLTYATRNTSEAFCKELVKHNAIQFVNEAIAKTAFEKEIAQKGKEKPHNEQIESKLMAHKYMPSDIIRHRDWFQWSWKYDPTITSMLTMIDAICMEMDWSLNLDDCRKRLENITFNYLDLGELNMSDELFIKMNARGKLLSDFDKLKSTLEEEIQIQQSEKYRDGTFLANAKIENEWRTYMDGKWIDVFWQQYTNNIMSQTDNESVKRMQLETAKMAETRLKIFILRMIALQLFAKMPHIVNEADKLRPSDDADEAELNKFNQSLKLINNLYEASYQLDAANIDNLILQYQNNLIDWRSNTELKPLPANNINIDFEQLIEEINLWIIDYGNGKYSDVTTLLSQDANFENSSETYFQRLSADRLGNDVTAVLFSMQQFLKLFLYKPESTSWGVNFNEWVRFSRNVFNNDNNTARIDTRKRLSDAIKGVENIIADLHDYTDSTDSDIYSNGSVIIAFLSHNNKTYIGIDNQSFEEEVHKASLRVSDNSWTNSIRRAEKLNYFWGQIRFLYIWSGDNQSKFDQYTDCFVKWVNISEEWEEDEQEKYYIALLCMQPDCWRSDNRLYEFNRDRDNSIKRYLRDDKFGYGISIKTFIDNWISWNPNSSFKEFCEHITSTEGNIGWIKYFKQRPRIIWQAWRKRFAEERGHIIFYQQKTAASHCFDPILCYIYENLKERFNNEQCTLELYDSKSFGSYGLRFTVSGFHSWEIRWGDNNGEYALAIDEGNSKIFDLDGIVSEMENVALLCQQDATSDISTED